MKIGDLIPSTHVNAEKLLPATFNSSAWDMEAEDP